MLEVRTAQLGTQVVGPASCYGAASNDAQEQYDGGREIAEDAPARQAVGDEPDDDEREEEGLQVGDTPATREPRGEPDRVESPRTLRRAAPEGDPGIDSRYEQDGEERRLDPVTDRAASSAASAGFPSAVQPSTKKVRRGQSQPAPGTLTMRRVCTLSSLTILSMPSTASASDSLPSPVLMQRRKYTCLPARRAHAT